MYLDNLLVTQYRYLWLLTVRVAEPEPHHFDRVGAVTRCSSGSKPYTKHG
jgi:hypothetical protein